MKILYFDCSMGAAGDMLAGALLELHPDKEDFLRRLNQLDIPGVAVSAERKTKCGIMGTDFHVKVHGVEEDEHLHDHHHHGSMEDVGSVIAGMDLPEEVKRNIAAVYHQIAMAESHVHGVPIHHIHFHELGTMDAVADITAVCLLIYELGIGKVFASPVHVGCGTVRCAHGILPVPAPATAYILQDVPIYGGKVQGELCTPTGAAVLKHFVEQFGEMPVMRVSKIGYGMGKRDFLQANCVRVMMGEI